MIGHLVQQALAEKRADALAEISEVQRATRRKALAGFPEFCEQQLRRVRAQVFAEHPFYIPERVRRHQGIAYLPAEEYELVVRR